MLRWSLRRGVDTVMKYLRLLRDLGQSEAKASEQDTRYLFITFTKSQGHLHYECRLEEIAACRSYVVRTGLISILRTTASLTTPAGAPSPRRWEDAQTGYK